MNYIQNILIIIIICLLTFPDYFSIEKILTIQLIDIFLLINLGYQLVA